MTKPPALKNIVTLHDLQLTPGLALCACIALSVLLLVVVTSGKSHLENTRITMIQWSRNPVHYIGFKFVVRDSAGTTVSLINAKTGEKKIVLFLQPLIEYEVALVNQMQIAAYRKTHCGKQSLLIYPFPRLKEGLYVLQVSDSHSIMDCNFRVHIRGKITK